METIYYLSTIIIILIKLDWLVSPIKKTNKIKRFIELSKLNEGKKFNDYTEEYKQIIYQNTISIFVPFWLFIGLFTFQWLGFIVFILFNFLIAFISRLVKFSLAYTIINWLNSLIGLFFCIFIIINHYHLKVNLTELFFNVITK